MQGEYRGDFSRDTFYGANHFCRVLMQQGRVQLDADWNEQTSILLHYLRGLGRDIIGQHGGPGNGFLITQFTSPVQGDFIITSGNYYVDGILCENNNPVLTGVQQTGSPSKINVTSGFGSEQMLALKGEYVEFSVDGFQTVKGPLKIVDVDQSELVLTLSDNLSSLNLTSTPTVSLRRVTTFLTQPDYPNSSIPTSSSSQKFLVYLDVWERHQTYVEDMYIREVALGGADTASRSKIIWQVKILNQTPKPQAQAPIIDDFTWQQFVAEYLCPTNRGLLKARVQPQMNSTDPCTISPTSAYRGAENQLYRVEIHVGGPAWNRTIDAATGQPGGNAGKAATFKWSRENGSVIFPIQNASQGGAIVTLATLGRDENLTLSANDWVEVVDDDYSLVEAERTAAAPLYQVQAIDRVGMKVTLNQNLAGATGTNPAKHPYLRRWDQQSGDPNQNGLTLQNAIGAALVLEGTDPGTWLNLEDGIQIQFQPSNDSKKPMQYRAGDYWLIPARVATGEIEWPRLRDAQGQPLLDTTSKQPIPDALPPHGVEHHYAPLAQITVAASNGIVTVSQPGFRRAITSVAR